MQIADFAKEQNQMYHLKIFRMLVPICRESAALIMNQFLEKANEKAFVWEKQKDLIEACKELIHFDLEWAKKIFYQVQILDPNFTEFNSGMANIYAHMDIEGAIQFSDKAVSIERSFILIEIVKVLMPKDNKRALKLLEEVYTLKPEGVANHIMCQIWMEIGRLLAPFCRKDALEALKKALHYVEQEESEHHKTVQLTEIMIEISNLDKELGMEILERLFEEVNNLHFFWNATRLLEIGVFINTLI